MYLYYFASDKIIRILDGNCNNVYWVGTWAQGGERTFWKCIGFTTDPEIVLLFDGAFMQWAKNGIILRSELL